MIGPGPFHTQVLAQLCQPPFSFQEKAFRFNTTCFGGDRYVCLKDASSADKGVQVGIVDLNEDLEIDRRTTRKADGAMKNPFENILALRGKVENQDSHFVQVFHLDNKARLGDFTFQDEIVFWKWLPNRCMIIITRSNVYHWFLRENMEAAETEPTLMFARSGKLAEADVQVINYSVDNEAEPADIQWCLLAGIYLSPTDRKVILGSLQLYSVQKQQQQYLEGHSGCFGTLNLDDWTQTPLRVFSFAERKGNQSKMYVMDIYAQRGDGRPVPFKATADFSYPSDAPNDLPIAQHMSPRHGVIYLATKAGYVMVFDAKTAQRLVCERVSSEGVFLCTYHKKTGGILLLNRKGALISVAINESNIISYIQANVTDGLPLALSLAKRYGYTQADEYLTQLFRQQMQAGKYGVAARIAAMCKGGSLRTPATIAAFKSARPNPDESSSPVVQYFNTLLEVGGRLTSHESLELMKPVVGQGRKDMPVKWLAEDKLECSEQLGDLVKAMDEQLAMKIYRQANCHTKVIQSYVEKGQFTEILSYVKRKKYTADFSFLLRSMLTIDPVNAINFTKQLLNNEPPLMDINQAIEVFLQQGKTSEISSVLVDILKANRPDQGPLQTKLIEMNLVNNHVQAAEAIFQQEIFGHYDRQKIAQLCEKHGMFKRAIEHYTDLPDIKRCMMRCGTQMNLDWLLSFCESLRPDSVIEILSDMLRTNRGNLNSVVQTSIKMYSKLGTDELIKMYEGVNSSEGLYLFLGSIIAFSNDPEVQYKYIECAAKLQNFTEVERIVRESKSYDPVKVKEFLKSIDLADPRPLIYVCDIHNFIEELAEYLYRRNLISYVEVYVTKVNSQAAAPVVVTLLDLGCQESFVTNLLKEVRGACALEPLIPEMEKRGKLELILPWMEGRLEEGITDQVLNNAIAKVYIDTNRDAEKFLATNLNYDPLIIGQYCQEKDPHMAVAAYIRGQCDQELINLTNRHGLYRIQAKYLVQRKSPEVWQIVLTDPTHRRPLVDQVVATALPEAKTIDEISVTVRAFSDANIPSELLELLERIVLQKSSTLPPELSNSTSLQNLLLLTAMSAEPGKVKDYINRLDSFDVEEVASFAISNFQLFEEALMIYKKAQLHGKAMDVVLTHMKDFGQAEAYAERVNDKQVWLTLGQAELEKSESLFNELDATPTAKAAAAAWIVKSMNHLARAEKCSDPKRVISQAKSVEKFDELVDFLKILRTLRLGAMGEIDSELVYCLARTQQWGALETFLMGAHTANTQMVGDRLFDEGQVAEDAADEETSARSFKAAKVFYAKVPNHTKLTLCHLKLNDHSAAFESAKRAGSTRGWTEVALAAIKNREFKIAHNAALNVVAYSDHLERLIEAYQEGKHFEELIGFLEAGVASGKGNIGVYTEMGVAYARHRPEKLLEFLKSAQVISAGRLNVPKLIKVCEKEYLWKACVLLSLNYNEYDQAAQTMMSHSSVAWEHSQFVSVVQKVTNTELLYKAIEMYLEQKPALLNSLLTSIAPQLDHLRVIQTLQRHRFSEKCESLYLSPVALIQSWLEEEQRRANEATSCVNDTLHDLYLAKSDAENLRRSINNFNNFDQPALAGRLETHELLEMKQLALSLYEKNGKYAHAIELAKRFKQFPQAIAIARKSGDSKVAESLLHYFVDELKSPQLFSACTQVCYSLIRPYVVMELSWTSGWTDEAQPFMIMAHKDVAERLERIEQELAKQSQQQQSDRKDKHTTELVSGLMGMGGMAMLPSGMSATPNAFSPFANTLM